MRVDTPRLIHIQCDEIRAHHVHFGRTNVHFGRTNQYFRHPSTLKAVIWCAPPDSHNLLSQKISVQFGPGSSRDMVKYVGKITKREREKERVLKIKENWPLLRNYLSK